MSAPVPVRHWTFEEQDAQAAAALQAGLPDRRLDARAHRYRQGDLVLLPGGVIAGLADHAVVARLAGPVGHRESRHLL